MQNFDVNNLKVAKPCPMGWENMNGDGRVRFCRACELNVYNISEMTAAEVQALIANSGGRICGRLFKRADGTVLTRDCPVGVRGYRKRAAKYAGAVLTAVLGFFSLTFGQTEPGKDKKSHGEAKIEVLKKESADEQTTIRGIVLDSNGGVIPGAEVTVKTKDKKKVSTITNSDGEYSISFPSWKDFTLKVKASGFKIYQKKDWAVNRDEDLKVDITLEMDSITMMIGVVGDLPLINSTNNSLITTIDKRRIDKLPH